MSPRNKSDNDSFKVRKGKVGNYTEHLSSEDIDYVDGLIEKVGCDFTREGDFV